MTGLAVAIVVVLFSFASANAQESPSLRVLISGGFRAAYQELVPEFERKTGHTIATAYGGSMGNAPNSIPNRLQRGEPADVVILARSALEELVKKHEVIPDSRVDLARSVIAMAVRAGAQKPDISSLDALKRTLLAAKSIAYSDSVSGVYLSTELFQRLGIAEAVRSKCIRVDVEMVGTVIARGDVEIGFQQLSELLPIAGIDIVGPLPPEAQKITVFSGGVPVRSKQPALAKQFLRFLASPEAADAIEKSGLQPVTERTETHTEVRRWSTLPQNVSRSRSGTLASSGGGGWPWPNRLGDGSVVLFAAYRNVIVNINQTALRGRQRFRENILEAPSATKCQRAQSGSQSNVTTTRSSYLHFLPVILTCVTGKNSERLPSIRCK